METKYVRVPFEVEYESRSCKANNRVKIACYDIKGDLKCVYTSAAEAARQTGLTNHTIFARCKNGNSGKDNLRFRYFNGDYSNIGILENVRDPNIPNEAKNISGEIFGYIKVLDLAYVKHRQVYWNCECHCGKRLVVNGVSLRTGKTRSCGCMKNVKHRLTSHPLHYVWSNMKCRCNNPNDKSYIHYGGRGIKVCDEWLNDFMAFYEWSINNGYNKDLSIDRIDVNGNYEPSNCRWTTIEVQSNNKRNTIFVQFRGTSYTISELSKITGIKRCTLYSRYKSGTIGELLDNCIPYNEQTAHLLGTTENYE